MYCSRKKILGPETLRAGNVLGPDLSHGQKCHGSRLVSEPDLSKYIEAELVQSIQRQNCLVAGIVHKFRAGSVSWPEIPIWELNMYFCQGKESGLSCYS